MTEDLRDYTYQDLVVLTAELGEKPFRAAQIYSWLFQKGAASIDEMTDLPEGLRQELARRFVLSAAEVIDVASSKDGTRKVLIGLGGTSGDKKVLIGPPGTSGDKKILIGLGGTSGETVESVIIREGSRLTLCVSSQTGCSLGCRFCLTGRSGPGRNLRLSELVAQYHAAAGLMTKGERITNVVLMGMGEPLNNYDEVVKFIRVLIDPRGFELSQRKVTLSTAGVVPGIKRLGSDVRISLAVSLNATTDKVRSRLMPINRRYPIKELLAALRAYQHGRRTSVTIEYVLIKNINDTSDDARRLARLLSGISAKINLIVFNPYPGSSFERPDEARCRAFQKILVGLRCKVVLRASKGADILAACGQLQSRQSG